MTFKLDEPDSPTCNTAIFTSVVAVTGTSVDSGRYTTSEAGTYRRTSSYSGDDAHSAVGPTPCGEGAESVIVDKARVVLNVAASQPTTSTIIDTATVVGGFKPTGTITFASPDPPSPSTATTPTSQQPRGQHRSLHRRAPGSRLPREHRAPSSVRKPGPGFVAKSGGGTTATYWGMGEDFPVPGDYDGDGTTDTAVFRPSTGSWYVDASAGRDLAVAQGAVGDDPVNLLPSIWLAYFA